MVPVNFRFLIVLPFLVLFFAISSLSLKKKWSCYLCGIFFFWGGGGGGGGGGGEFTNFDIEVLHAGGTLNYIHPRKRNAHPLTQASKPEFKVAGRLH